MQYQVTSDNMDISPSMTALAKKKLSGIEAKLKNINKDLKSVRVVLNSAPQETFETKIELVLGGKTYVAEAAGFSLENSLISAVEELGRQMAKFRSIIEREWEEKRTMKRISEEELENV